METKPINTTDSPINNLNRPGAYDDSNNDARWFGLNVLPQVPGNYFGAINPHAATQVPAISARAASATALAPSSTGKKNVEIFQRNYEKIRRDLEPVKVLSNLYSKFVIEREDMENVKAEKTRTRRAEAFMSIIQDYLDKAANSNRKMVIMFLVHDAISRSQRHLANLLDQSLLMPFEQYPEAVKNEITDVLDEKDVLALTAHLRLNNATAREHDDNTHQAFGTKEKFPVQESGGYNPW